MTPKQVPINQTSASPFKGLVYYIGDGNSTFNQPSSTNDFQLLVAPSTSNSNTKPLSRSVSNTSNQSTYNDYHNLKKKRTRLDVSTSARSTGYPSITKKAIDLTHQISLVHANMQHGDDTFPTGDDDDDDDDDDYELLGEVELEQVMGDEVALQEKGNQKQDNNDAYSQEYIQVQEQHDEGENGRGLAVLEQHADEHQAHILQAQEQQQEHGGDGAEEAAVSRNAVDAQVKLEGIKSFS